MTDWLEAVAAREVGVRLFREDDSGSDPYILLTPAERDRLVRIARGVRELAATWAEMSRDTSRCGALVAWELSNCAAELRKLEDV